MLPTEIEFVTYIVYLNYSTWPKEQNIIHVFEKTKNLADRN